MRIATKVVSGIVTAIACLLLVSVIAWFVGPRILGLEPQVVLSGSMEPALQTGAVAFMRRTDAADIRVGDMMTFKHPEQPGVIVTHRVVDISRGDSDSVSFTTRGDANEGADPWSVPATNVLGRVVWDVPHAGLIAERIRSPLGFFFLMAIPAAYIAVGEARSIVRELRNRKRGEAPT